MMNRRYFTPDLIISDSNDDLSNNNQQILFDDIVFFFLLEQNEQEQQEGGLINHRSSFKDQLTNQARSDRQRRIPRCALVDPLASPWKRLYASRHNGAIITLTSLNFACFDYLLEKFSPVYDEWTPYSSNWQFKRKQVDRKRGRPRSLDAAACLGLVLCWNRVMGNADHFLSMVFGITQSPLSLFLRFGRRILYNILKNDPY